MSSRTTCEKLVVRLAMVKREPQWQHLAVGTRVKPVGRQRIGMVIEIVDVDGLENVTTRVRVRWESARGLTETWPTDFLIIVPDQEGPS